MVATQEEDFEDAPILCDMAASLPRRLPEQMPTRQIMGDSQRHATYGGGHQTRDISNVSVGTGTFSLDLSNTPNNPVECDTSEFTVKCSMTVVYSKMKWATAELQQTSAVENSTNLCQLIKSCADALEALRKLNPSGGK